MDKTQNPWLPPGEGWIEWQGGENPVPGAVVECVFRDEPNSMPSDDLVWLHEGRAGDIVAYRVDTPAPTSTSRDELFDELVRTLQDVRGAGLSYWEPQTKLGHQNKSAMIERVNAVLSKARAA